MIYQGGHLFSSLRQQERGAPDFSTFDRPKRSYSVMILFSRLLDQTLSLYSVYQMTGVTCAPLLTVCLLAALHRLCEVCR